MDDMDPQTRFPRFGLFSQKVPEVRSLVYSSLHHPYPSAWELHARESIARPLFTIESHEV